jgi:hypothetical protein
MALASVPAGEPPEVPPPGVGARPAGMPQPVAATSGPYPEASDLAHALDVIRARFDEEYRITERLDAKQRQAATQAGGLFAIVQTIAFAVFTDPAAPTFWRALLVALIVCAAGALAIMVFRLHGAESLRPETTIDTSRVFDWCQEANGPEYVTMRLITSLDGIVRARGASNDARAKRAQQVQRAALWALAFSSAELALAIALRI